MMVFVEYSFAKDEKGGTGESNATRWLADVIVVAERAAELMQIWRDAPSDTGRRQSAP